MSANHDYPRRERSPEPWWPAIVRLIISGVGMHTTLRTWATTLSDRARATAVSLFAGFMFLGNGVGASITGYVLDFEGSTALFLGATVVMIALTAVSVVSRIRYAVRLG